jgi:hypothetical protein
MLLKLPKVRSIKNSVLITLAINQRKNFSQPADSQSSIYYFVNLIYSFNNKNNPHVILPKTYARSHNSFSK